jgi:hypothetical protein
MPGAVRIIITGASVRGTAAVNELCFLGDLLHCSRAVVLGVEGTMMVVALLLGEASADSTPVVAES